VWALVALPWLTPLVNIFVKLRLWRPRRFTQYSQQALRFSLMLWRISNNKPVPSRFCLETRDGDAAQDGDDCDDGCVDDEAAGDT